MRILIVEDDAAAVEALTTMLVQLFNGSINLVVSRGTVKDAVESILAASVSGAPFDVCLLDLGLKQSSANETLATFPFDRVPTVVVTGHDQFSYKAIEAGAEYFMVKPVRMGDLGATVIKSIRSNRRQREHEMLLVENRALKEKLSKVPEMVASIIDELDRDRHG